MPQPNPLIAIHQIDPDLATCDDCLKELCDPQNRRHRYPFISCSHCGPRYTLVRDRLPDRLRTTMAPFEMCPLCRQEVDRTEDRRSGYDLNSCPACGPRLLLLGPHGQPLDAVDPLLTVTDTLRDGLIVAIKGVGGFHLACDASSPQAVTRLRIRRNRDQRPLTVMVKDLDEALAMAQICEAERCLLTSAERSVVLLRRQPESPLAREVAPGSPYVRLMLPFTALHYLILDQLGRPLVMTPGNRGEEPIAYLNMEAVERLGDVADLFLVHDREIETRCDDSIAKVIQEQPTLLRRSIGYVPRGMSLATPISKNVLACGASLRNTFCLATKDTAFLGPHIGDLDNLETFEAYQSAIKKLERLLDVRPEVVAHDLHPDYLSTTYARNRAELVTVAVQHHHAHVASAMGEHGLEGPVIGVAYDGTGHGTDGTAWGGELLLATFEKYKRVATFRPIPLAGGDKAVRQVWRIALALLDDAFDGAADLSGIGLFQMIDGQEIDLVRQMIRQRLNTPLARGIGRYFEGVGSLVLNRIETSFDGQLATEWEHIAGAVEGGQYGYTIDFECNPWMVDLRPMIRDIAGDLKAGRHQAAISAGFHNTIQAATIELVRSARAQYGKAPVVLTGGCFQNVRLTEGLIQALSPEFEIHTHHLVPPGDGGLALGQALIAAAAVQANGQA